MTSQYRCDTCKDVKCSIHPEYRGSRPFQGATIVIIREWNRQKGCASHSDFQSERKKVLDELIAWLDGQVPKKDLEHPFYECKTRTKGKIEELRKSGE